MFCEKFYFRLIEYCKNKPINERIKNRNSLDERLFSGKKIYTENHHILPLSQGGTDDSINLIKVLPEEHLILHKLRFKLFKNRADLHAVHMMILNLNDRNQSGSWNKKYSKTRAWYAKHNKGENHPLFGTHRPESVKKAISSARQGTMPVKDIKTGKILGSVDIDHPMVLSGNWVHHSKGNKHSLAARKNYSINTKMQNNPNWGGIEDIEILKLAEEFYNKTGFWMLSLWNDFLKEKNRVLPKHWSKNRFAGKSFNTAVSEFLKIPIEKMYEYQYHRSDQNKMKISESLKGRIWYHNDKLEISKQLKETEITEEWSKGRKKYVKN